MPATKTIRTFMARIATMAQVVTALANAILNWLSPSDLSVSEITLLCSAFLLHLISVGFLPDNQANLITSPTLLRRNTFLIFPWRPHMGLRLTDGSRRLSVRTLAATQAAIVACECTGPKSLSGQLVPPDRQKPGVKSWSPNADIFPFDPEENFLNRLDLLFLDWLFPLRCRFFLLCRFALLRHGEISIFLFGAPNTTAPIGALLEVYKPKTSNLSSRFRVGSHCGIHFRRS
jgi:hypothetical protein